MGVINEHLTSPQRVAMQGALELLMGNHREPSPEWEKQAAGVIFELVAVLTTAPADQQRDPLGWSTAKPSAMGAYWIKGFSSDAEQAALVEVDVDEEGELVVNLHQNNSERDYGYWYLVSEINNEFEWAGPLSRHPPALAAQYKSYTTQPAESLAGMAARQLKDESRWIEIRDANAQAFPDMGPSDYYPVGSIIKIPSTTPTPVAVVLPKHMNEHDAVEKLLGRFGVYGVVPADVATDIYNCALADVAKLNEVKSE